MKSEKRFKKNKSILPLFISLIIILSFTIFVSIYVITNNSSNEQNLNENSNPLKLGNLLQNQNVNPSLDLDDLILYHIFDSTSYESRGSGSSGSSSSSPTSEADNLDNPTEDSAADSDNEETDTTDNFDSIDNIQTSDDKKSKLIDDENDGFIDVIVMLKDDEVSDEMLGIAIDSPVEKKLSEIKSKVKTKQDKVLSALDSSEFLLKHKYKTVSGFAGKITQEGWDKLEQDPDVEAIYENELLHITLMEAIPLINADDIHDLNITGEGTVVCVVDTGIDYTHPDLGNCTGMNYNINGNVVSHPEESSHPYVNDYDNTWTITKPGFSQIAVHFSDIKVEEGYDYILIKDANDTIVQSLTGNHKDIWSVSVPGDTIKINLVTDYSVTGWGFAINKVLDGTATFYGNIVSHSEESSHPYNNSFDYTWTITKPGFSNIAVHFSNITIEGGWDYILVKDANDTIVQSLTGNYKNIWGFSVPGDTIKINLVTDSSITDWGFAIDKVLNGTTFSLQNCRKVIDGYDFVNNDNDPMDDNRHGTHVAGIVAANGELKGVAPDAELVAVKVCNSGGGCWWDDIAAGVDWCNDKKLVGYNIVATTMSLGGGGPYNSTNPCPTETPIEPAINIAHDLGIVVTVSSGNDGYSNGISYPACSPNAISVGAVYDANFGQVNWAACTDTTTFADKIVCFTNTGPLLDLLAPGAFITSTRLGGGYIGLGGTSMAAPHVAGAIALAKQFLPLASPDEIVDVLKSTGIQITDLDNGLNFSRIDLLAAARSIVECFSNSDCDDSNPNTEDICNAPGTIESNCTNLPITCLINSDCGTDEWVGDSYCQKNNSWQNYITYTCNNPATSASYCSNSTAPKLKEDCGEDYCEAWQDNYCKDGDIYHNRICHDTGCSGGVCYDDLTTEEQEVQECEYGCTEGRCLVEVCEIVCNFGKCYEYCIWE